MYCNNNYSTITIYNDVSRRWDCLLMPTLLKIELQTLFFEQMELLHRESERVNGEQ